MGVDLVTNRRIKDGQVIVAGHIISINLKVVSMTDFDVILGMLWLAENYEYRLPQEESGFFATN